VVIKLKKSSKKKAGFYIALFSILDPQVKEQQDKKGLKKNKKKNIGEVVAHSC